MTKYLSILFAGKADPRDYGPFLLFSMTSIVQRITSNDRGPQIDGTFGNFMTCIFFPSRPKHLFCALNDKSDHKIVKACVDQKYYGPDAIRTRDPRRVKAMS